MPTPINVPVPINTAINIAANSNASFTQTLTVSNETTTVTFTGTGENVPMRLPDGSTATSLTSPKAGFLILTFSSSGNPNPEVNTPVEHTDGNIEIITVTSEDFNDQDNNDTYAFLAWTIAGTERSKSNKGVLAIRKMREKVVYE